MSGRRSRRGHGGGGGGGGGHGGGDARWLVTYADLLTLLMVLFLVLWVISTIDLKKFEKFKSGLGDFGNKAAAAAKDPSVTDPLSTDIVGAATTTSIVIPSTTDATGSNGEATSTTVPGGGTATGDGKMLDPAALASFANGLQGAIDNAGLTGVVTLKNDPRGLVIAVTTDDVLFDAGSATLGPRAATVIGVVAPQLSKIGNAVTVEGYTDKRPLKKGADYDNWDLSVDRAVRVVKLLRDSFGVDPARLSATGYGEQHPIASGNDEASLAKNRRVQIVVIPAGATP
jgi:chemotaxis protein MotB